MPFDSTELDDGIIAFVRFHDEPSLRGLSYALRHPELWPKGFVWNYSDCRSCAMGLAWRLSNENIQPMSYTDWAWRTFNITQQTVRSLFVRHALFNRFLGGKLIKPKHVADAIDRYLAKGNA